MKFKTNACDGIYNDCLDIRFTKSCDNNCSFCIEKNGIDSLGETNVNQMIENTIKSNKKIVLILGGEPFLNPNKLLQYIKGIRSYVQNIYITTSLPKTIDLNNNVVLDILNTIDGLNVSLQHYDWVINNDILNASSKHNRLEILSNILKVKALSLKVRVSINLVKGYIDDKEKLMTCINLLHKMNCKHIKINELQNVGKDIYVSFENIMNIKMKSPYSFGCQTDISDIFKNYNMKFTLKRSCFVVKDKDIAKVNVCDLIKAIKKRFDRTQHNNMCVMYENGMVNDGWMSK